MTNPNFSIIIACYNSQKFLSLAIDSLLSQTYKDFEVIVVDGGSNDGTLEVLKSYGKKISRWISEPDSGIYDAWNKGIRLSKGRWIGFIGADDVYLPNALEEYAKYVACYSEMDYVSSRVELFDGMGRSRIIGKPWAWKSFRHYMCVAHVGSLHARRLFDKYGFFSSTYRICGDYELLLRAGKNLQAGFLNQTLARMRTGGVSSANSFVLFETLIVKLNTRTITPLVAYWDYVLASAKWYFRRLMTKL